jgi:hypothetical protein
VQSLRPVSLHEIFQICSSAENIGLEQQPDLCLLWLRRRQGGSGFPQSGQRILAGGTQLNITRKEYVVRLASNLTIVIPDAA